MASNRFMNDATHIGPYYDGSVHKATSGRHEKNFNPATGQVSGQIQISSEKDVDAAISSAQKAFPSWSKLPPAERSNILLKAASLLREYNDSLAAIETLDTGKASSETTTVDIVTGADTLEYYARLVGSGGLNGETTRLRDSAWVYTTKEPLGVCAGIGAWNYPIQIALWKSAPCLAAGNCMVYKPSEFTSAHSVPLAKIYAEAGVPPGVFNVVHGAGDVGAYLVNHPSIAKVSFTGQVSTGQKVASQAAQGMKYVTMELGGKSPLLVLPDCNVENAVDGAMMANFFSTGQVCTNGTRVFVPRSMKAKFEKRLVEKMQYVRIGDPKHPDTNFGPLVSDVHRKKVMNYIEHGAKVDKARVLYDGSKVAGHDGKQFKNTPLAHGYWCPPYVFTDCTDDMKICREEIFGPVMSILSYSDENAHTKDEDGEPPYLAHLLKRANDTPLGLAAGVFTKDLNLAHKVVSRLEAGITWINTWGESPAEMSVGGWKLSGVGVENGRQGLDHWTQNRSTLVEMGGAVGTVFTKLSSSTQSKL